MEHVFDQDMSLQEMNMGCTDCHGTCARTCSSQCHGSGHKCFPSYEDIS